MNRSTEIFADNLHTQFCDAIDTGGELAPGAVQRMIKDADKQSKDEHPNEFNSADVDLSQAITWVIDNLPLNDQQKKIARGFFGG